MTQPSLKLSQLSQDLSLLLKGLLLKGNQLAQVKKATQKQEDWQKTGKQTQDIPEEITELSGHGYHPSLDYMTQLTPNVG